MRAKAKELLEKAGLSETYWGKKIIDAECQKGFDAYDCAEARSWQTCACGKQDSRIPRDVCGIPLDNKLANLGSDFDVYVNCDDFVAAAETLIEIKKRAEEILAMMVL